MMRHPFLKTKGPEKDRYTACSRINHPNRHLIVFMTNVKIRERLHAAQRRLLLDTQEPPEMHPNGEIDQPGWKMRRPLEPTTRQTQMQMRCMCRKILETPTMLRMFCFPL